ncbi:MAG TPA: DNA recombination protein RmuC [Sphingobium sp.]|nr:DNA recombination protein RmuC [Sphingobium sp.]
MDAMNAAFILIALAGGFLLAWLLRGRDAARLAAERVELADRLARSEEMRNAALRDLAVEKERADQAVALRAQLAELAAARDQAERELLAIRADHKARTESFEAQIAALTQAREQMSAQFSEIGGKLLGEAQRAFLDRADQRLAQAQEKNESQIKALLTPVETTLKRYEEGLGRVERDRVDSYAALREAVEQVRLGNSEARAETARLVNALRSSPKARGRWGEQQLQNVLEMAGLSSYVDYRTEVSVDTEDGRLRPDVIVRLPGGRQLIIDAKCSLNAYLEAAEADDEAHRGALLKAHAGAIRTHAQQLGAKDYWTRFGDAADYVVMFIPGEHFLSAALEQDGDLWEWAFERRVLLATPTNLVAIARTVANVWRQEKMAEEAQQIGTLGKEMYERLAVAAGHLRKVGGGLNNAVSHYNNFVASFDSRVVVTARKFRDLNIDTGGKDIDAIEAVDLMARLPEPLAVLPGAAE